MALKKAKEPGCQRGGATRARAPKLDRKTEMRRVGNPCEARLPQLVYFIFISFHLLRLKKAKGLYKQEAIKGSKDIERERSRKE